MSIWDWLFRDASSHDDCVGGSPPDINPATGLQMVGDGIGGVDAGGSPYGMDVHQDWHDHGYQDLASFGLSEDD